MISNSSSASKLYVKNKYYYSRCVYFFDYRKLQLLHEVEALRLLILSVKLSI